MRKKEILRRRRLATSIRKRITSYYSEAEQKEIVTAAASQGISLSSFVASVVLREARNINSRKKS